MAKKPIQNAFVNITVGGQTRAVYTDSLGIGSIQLSLRESQYNGIDTIRVTASKDGYVDGETILSSLPSFSNAINRGIQISVKIDNI